MIKKILVCLEGSPSCEEASRYAAKTALALGAELVGLAIVDEADIRGGQAVGIGGSSYKRDRDEALIADAREQAAGWLQRFTATSEAAGVRSEARQLVGRAAASILREMQAHDLTVLGRDANFHFETDESDPETRDYVLHRAKRPIVLVPAEPAPAKQAVLLAYDGSSAVKRAITAFATSGLAAGRSVHVACVNDDGGTAWEMANYAVDLLAEHKVPAEIHNIVTLQSIPDALLGLGRELGAELFVMGAYARSRFSELLWGSTTRQLIEKSPFPLFLHH